MIDKIPHLSRYLDPMRTFTVLSLRRSLPFLISVLFLLGPGNPRELFAQDARYIIRFKQAHRLSGSNPEGRVAALQEGLSDRIKSLNEVALQEIDRIPRDNSVVVRLKLEDALKVSARPDVASLELDSRVYALFDTNDQVYSQQYALNGEFGGRASLAWDTTTGSSRALVAVIDTGADLNHPDLTANLWRNSKEIRGNGRDDDSNGCIDDIHGCDLVNKDGSPQDDNGHGTHVSGIVAALGNNGIGVAGVAWGSKIVVVKALDSQGGGFISGIAKAIDYVSGLKAKGVPIVAVNLSLGGGGYSNVIYRAVERARNHDILTIAAAGNESANNDSRPLYPASLNLDSVVGVAATDSAGALASYSNFGVGSVHIAAPGTQIWSTALRRPDYSYRTSSGTSMASPYVAGVVSLISAANPSLSMLQVRSILLSAVRPLDSLKSSVITGAIVDAQAAVAAARVTKALPRVYGVVTRRSRGVVDATVTIESRGSASGVAAVTRSTTTSGDGSYSFSELPLGRYIIRVKKTRLKFASDTADTSRSARGVKRNFEAG